MAWIWGSDVTFDGISHSKLSQVESIRRREVGEGVEERKLRNFEGEV
jgi:hypothetical protein